MFTETVHGLSTIRAMRAQSVFYDRYKQLLDDYLRAQFADIACNKWLSMRLQLLGMVIISAVISIALLDKAAAGRTSVYWRDWLHNNADQCAL